MMQAITRRLKALGLGTRAKGSLILSAATFARNILGLVNVILIARYLGPDDFGRLMFAFALASILAPLAAVGIERLAVRQIVADPDRTGPIAATALCLRLTGAFVGLVIAVTLAAAGLIYDDADPVLTLLASFMLMQAAFDALAGVLTANEKFAHAALPLLAGGVATFLYVLYLVAEPGRSLEAFAAMRLIDALIIIVALIAALRISRISLQRFRPSQDILFGFLRKGFPILLAAITYTVFLRMDQLMLAALSTEAELGAYSLSLRLAEALNFVPAMIGLAFYPHLARLYDEAKEEYDKELHFLFDVMAVASVGLIIVVWTVAVTVLVPFFGEGFKRSSGMAMVLAIAIPFVAIGMARGSIFTITGQVWLPLAIWSGPVIVNFAGNALMIPIWGGYGAAASTVLSLFVAHFVTTFFVPALRPHGAAMMRSLNIPASAGRVLRRLRIL